MAKKAKTPPPPRRPVQSPQQRSASRTPGESRKFLYLVLFAAAGLVILGAVLAVLVFSGGSSGGGSKQSAVAAAMRKAGCTSRDYTMPAPKGGAMHINSLDAKIKWVTDPPSGGQHYGNPAPFDFYDKAVNPRIVVHNLEHGAVVIWYGTKIPAQTKDTIRSFYRSSPVGVLATPYPKLGTKIALAAWTGISSNYQKNGYYGEGHLAVCKGFNEKAFKTFRDAYRGHGPEGFPLKALQPGQ